MTRVLALAVAGLLAACGTPADLPPQADPGEQSPTPEPEPTPAPEPAVTAVALVAPITDLAARVLGERGTVASLVPMGADSHTWEPTPGSARLLETADIFIANGLMLNENARRLADANLPDGAPTVLLAELTLSEDAVIHDHMPHVHGEGEAHTHDTEGDPEPNPHVWMDPRYAMEYVRHIAAALSRVDPDGAEDYEANAEEVITELEALDAAIADALATVPEANRKLVTYHDGWSYFARRYGLELVFAIQPADFSEPSAHEVRHIIDQIRAESIPAVFGSEVFPSDVLAVIAEETGAEYVADLSDDELPGEPGDPEHSYVGMMVRNIQLMVAALGGDPAPLDPVVPAR
jgi:ABC-type Zn uptake system ZnuABC Zn-binding protein ZnuA